MSKLSCAYVFLALFMLIKFPHGFVAVETEEDAWTPWSDYGECNDDCVQKKERYCGGLSLDDCSGMNVQYKVCDSRVCRKVAEDADAPPTVQSSVGCRDIEYSPIGCFKTQHKQMDIVMEDKWTPKPKEIMIAYKGYKKELDSMACRCAVKAKKLGYKYISFSKGSRCWGGKHINLMKQKMKDPKKKSRRCFSEYLKPFLTHQKTFRENFAFITRDIDGGYSAWGTWTPCSAECGFGYQIRERTCSNPYPEGIGRDCARFGEPTELKMCKVKECPIDGAWSEYKPATKCTVKCGGGTQTLKRTCTRPTPMYGGEKCIGPTTKIGKCNMQPCPINGGWSKYTTFSKCTAKCGGGKMTRTRKCTNPVPKYGGLKCTGSETDTAKCNIHPCPINGGWSIWSKFTVCSVKCGGGTRTQTRTCTKPAPKHGGKKCTGKTVRGETCNSHPCPINGAWSKWTKFTVCTAVCGGGTMKQTRTCTAPAPMHGGLKCAGPKDHIVPCNTHPCPINGGWSTWGKLSTCSVKCGGGTKSQTRTCTNPKPQFKGLGCVGPATRNEKCNTHPCPINGVWALWGKFTKCTVPCGGGTMTQKRTCIAPQYGGVPCTGPTINIVKCNTQPCPINGGWSRWSKFGKCTATCGGGTKAQTRACTNPAPKYEGAKCAGLALNTVKCNTQPCPVNGGYCPWMKCKPCTRLCDGGRQYWHRHCEHPEPRYGGKSCVGLGPFEKVTACNTEPCPEITQCVTKSSRWSYGGGGDVTYLARLGMKCGIGEVLNGFRLQKSGSFIRYKFTCCKIRSGAASCNMEPKRTRFTTASHGSALTLEKHMVYCGNHGILTSFGIQEKTAAHQIRYTYNCCNMKAKKWIDRMDCYFKDTPYSDDGKGVSYYLLNQDIHCKPGYALSFFKLHRHFEYDAYNFRIKCCRVDYTS